MKKYFLFLFFCAFFYGYAEHSPNGLGSLGEIPVQEKVQDPGYQHNKNYYVQNPQGMVYPDFKETALQYLRSGTSLPFEEYLVLQGYSLEIISSYLQWYQDNQATLVGTDDFQRQWKASPQMPEDVLKQIQLYQTSGSPLSFQEYLSVRGYTPSAVRMYSYYYNMGFQGQASSFIQPSQMNGSLPQEVEEGIGSL